MGDPRRRHPELQGGRQRLRAARRGVPEVAGPRTPRTSSPRSTSAAPLGTPQRESCVRQMIGRVVDTITGWGVKDGYFATDDGRPDLLRRAHPPAGHPEGRVQLAGVVQRGGARHAPAVLAPASSSPSTTPCRSILNWYVEEGTIFKGGSGSGINLSPIRSSKEQLAGGGTASGPVSFMRGADASAGTIKSGGKTRRAAKMVDPQRRPPRRPRLHLVQGRRGAARRGPCATPGSTWTSTARTAYSMQYQNANNSVRVTDEFMQAYRARPRLEAEGGHSPTRRVETVRARDLMREIAAGGVGVRRPRHAVRHHHQRVAHVPGHRAASTRRTRAASTCTWTTARATWRRLNLMKFLDDDGNFDVAGFKHAVEVVFTAQEIIVGNSSYPTEKIGRNARGLPPARPGLREPRRPADGARPARTTPTAVGPGPARSRRS